VTACLQVRYQLVALPAIKEQLKHSAYTLVLCLVACSAASTWTYPLDGRFSAAEAATCLTYAVLSFLLFRSWSKLASLRRSVKQSMPAAAG
jgi:hypothetical protein